MRIITWVGVKKWIQLWGVCTAVLLVSLSAFSQANSGRILGSISDQTGGAIAGATVSVRDVERGTTRTLTTDEAGAYNAPNLVPGSYTVKVEFQGFRTVERQNIVLEVGKEVRVDLSLQPGDQAQTITVTEAVPLVETTNATLGGTLSNAAIEDMPLNGRNFMNLLQLRPGVTIYPGGGAWTQSTNGMRPEHNVYILDGITAMEPFSAQSTVNGVGLSGDVATLLPIDAIQEFQTQQNPKAEYGFKPGSITNIGLKSGTNSLHGTANAFGRTDVLDAKNPFLPDGQKQSVNLKQFGASLGGPIRKDKMFFYAGYEGQRYEIGNPAAGITYPTLSNAASVGKVSNGNVASLVQACLNDTALAKTLSPTSLTIAGLNSSCVPTGPTIFQNTDSATLFVNLVTQLQVDNGLAKIDYHINEKNILHGMYYAGQNTGFPVNSTSITQPYWRPTQRTRSQIIGTTWNYVPNSSIVNEARFGFSRYTQAFAPGDCPGSGAGQPDALFAQVNQGTINCGFMNITLTGFQGAIGCCGSFPKFQGPDMSAEFIDNVSWLHGNHSFKFGGEYMKTIYNGGTFSNGRGRVTFASLEDFLDANFGSPLRVLVGSPRRHVTQNIWSGFFQDDWRIKPRLVLNLGLRYEYVTPIKEANDQLANFDRTQGIVQVGKQIGEPYHADPNNFAPRIGFAWDIQGNGKTVLRGGGGVIYVLEGFNIFLSQQNGTNTTTGMNTNPSGFQLCTGKAAAGPCVAGPGDIKAGALQLSPGQVNWNQSAGANGGAIFPSGSDTSTLKCATDRLCGIQAVSPNIRDAYVTNWSLDIQRAITNNISLDVGYVGNHATKLWGINEENNVPVGTGWTGTTSTLGTLATCFSSFGTAKISCLPSTAKIQGARPFNPAFPYLSNIYLLSNYYESNYNGLQMTLTQRPTHGLSYTIGFSFAHALDDATNDWSGQPSGQDPSNPQLEYSNSGFDIRKRLTATITYALPGRKGFAQTFEGWKVTSIVGISSALPWGVIQPQTAENASGTSQFLDRWNFYGNPDDFSGMKAASVPFFPGTVKVAGTAGTCGVGKQCFVPNPALPAACTSAAAALDQPGNQIGTASLYNWGCFVNGSTVMIPPALGTYGNMTRNTFRGNGLHIWDFSVIKEYKITERFGAEFRFEVFNLLNQTQYANPQFNGPGGNDPWTSPGQFGTALATPDVSNNNPSIGSGAARTVQVGMKLSF